MRFEVTILGTSSALPTKSRFPSSQVVNHNEKFFMIDCGEAAQIQIRKTKISFQKINVIFISHLHADHYLGLPGLIASMDLLGRTTELHIYCPKGLDEFLETNFRISGTYLRFKIYYHFHEFDSSKLIWENDELEVFSFPLKHRLPCVGFVFKEKEKLRKFNKHFLEKYLFSSDEIMDIKAGADWVSPDGEHIANNELTVDPPDPKTYAYCSDTCFLPQNVEYFFGANLLYHEATFMNEHAGRAKDTLHSTSTQAAEIAKLANAKKLILGHFSIRYPDLSELIAEARTVFENTEAAEEGKVYLVQ